MTPRWIALGCALLVGAPSCKKKDEDRAAPDLWTDLMPRWIVQETRLRYARIAVAERPEAKPCASIPARTITIGRPLLDEFLDSERHRGDWNVGPIGELANLGDDDLMELMPRGAEHLDIFRTESELEEMASSLQSLEAATHVVVLTVDDYQPSQQGVAGRLGAWVVLAALDDAPPLCAAHVSITGEDDDSPYALVEKLVEAAPDALTRGTAPRAVAPVARATPLRRDVDGDGIADFMIAVPDRDEVLLYRGARGSEPKAPAQRLAGLGAAIVGDMNGDKLADALISDSDGGVWFAAGSKKGLVLGKSKLPAPARLGTAIAAHGDVDRDGFDDALIVGDDSDDVQPGDELVEPADAGPSDDATPTDDAGPARDPFLADEPGRGARPDPTDDDAFEADDDGTRSAETWLFRGSKRGPGEPTKVVIDAGMDAVGDVNADGFADVVIDGGLHLGTAAGMSIEPAADVGEWVAGIGDFDGDGIDDLARATERRLEWYAGAAGRLPTRPASNDNYPFEVEADTDRRIVAIGDIDGDREELERWVFAPPRDADGQPTVVTVDATTILKPPSKPGELVDGKQAVAGNQAGESGAGKGTIGTGKYGGKADDAPPGAPPASAADQDKATIRRYIKRNLSKITYCYEKELLDKPGLSGTVDTRFKVGRTGNAEDVHASGLDEEVAACIVEVIKTIEFPVPYGGGTVSVTSYPFQFHPAGE